MKAARLLAALPVAVVCFAACRERGRPDPNIRMAVSHEQDAPAETAQGAASTTAPGPAGQAPAIPNRLEVPNEVAQAYGGIRLTWRDASSGKEGTVEVPLGGSAKLPGSDLEVGADVFLPAFTMSSQVITSSGTSEENPAARIRVAENGKEIFAGWIFKRFPDVHPFSHPRFSLRLDGGVRRSSA